MLPFESGATTYLDFNRVRQATESAQGSRRCQAKFNSSNSARGIVAELIPNFSKIDSKFS